MNFEIKRASDQAIDRICLCLQVDCRQRPAITHCYYVESASAFRIYVLVSRYATSLISSDIMRVFNSLLTLQREKQKRCVIVLVLAHRINLQLVSNIV